MFLRCLLRLSIVSCLIGLIQGDNALTTTTPMVWTDATSTVGMQGFAHAGTPSIAQFNGTFVIAARLLNQPSPVSSAWSEDGREFRTFSAIGRMFDVTSQPQLVVLNPDHLVVFLARGAVLYQTSYNFVGKSFDQLQTFFTDASDQQIDNIGVTIFNGEAKLLIVTWTVVKTGLAWIGIVPFSAIIQANYNLTAVAFTLTYPLPMPQVADSLAVLASAPTPLSAVPRLYIIGQSMSSSGQHVVAFSSNPLSSTQWNVTGPSSIGALATTFNGLIGSSSPVTGCNSSWALLIHSTDNSLQYSMMDVNNILVASPVPFINSTGGLVRAIRPATIMTVNQSTYVYSFDEAKTENNNLRLFINENTQTNTHDCVNATAPVVPGSNTANGMTNNHLLNVVVSVASILLFLSVI